MFYEIVDCIFWDRNWIKETLLGVFVVIVSPSDLIRSATIILL